MINRRFVGLLLIVFVVWDTCPAVEPDYAKLRAVMVEEIAADAYRTGSMTGRARIGDSVIEALRTVPRHLFVPKYLRNQAYENRPLPIGHGQTISQPSIVALMTELLELDAGDRVLEIGTGSGYQAAILAAMAARVHTIEIIEPLFRQARNRFHRMGQMSIETRHGDGYYGWPEAQPFDGIVVTAASDHVPPPLIKQLAPGGRMVIPVGDRFTTQQLLMIHKELSGKVTTRHVLPVIFVPLTGER